MRGSFTEEFSKNSRSSFVDGSTFSKWRVVFGGSLTGISNPYVQDGFLVLNPEPVYSPDTTNAALVVSQTYFTSPSLHLESSWVTTAQTRVGSDPNAWEMGWLIWDYTDNDHFTYLVLKPNGWEIGRRDPAFPGGQRFIATGDSLLTPVGQYRSVTVDRLGVDTSVTVDGVPLVSFQVGADEASGAVGMYVEDATAKFDRIRVDSR
jgi:hypothetical protein